MLLMSFIGDNGDTNSQLPPPSRVQPTALAMGGQQLKVIPAPAADAHHMVSVFINLACVDNKMYKKTMPRDSIPNLTCIVHMHIHTAFCIKVCCTNETRTVCSHVPARVGCSRN